MVRIEEKTTLGETQSNSLVNWAHTFFRFICLFKKTLVENISKQIIVGKNICQRKKSLTKEKNNEICMLFQQVFSDNFVLNRQIFSLNWLVKNE